MCNCGKAQRADALISLKITGVECMRLRLHDQFLLEHGLTHTVMMLFEGSQQHPNHNYEKEIHKTAETKQHIL